MDINNWCTRAYVQGLKMGWYQDNQSRNIFEVVADIHAEASEAYEDYRDN